MVDDVSRELYNIEHLMDLAWLGDDRIPEFLQFGPVSFDTLVLHTGSGDIVPLSNYFNR